jgi:AraC-like DNA-binding protein
VARAVQFIREHFHDTELKVADIGPALGFKSSDYLARVFGEQQRRRMQEYLADCRLRHARWLLIHTRLGIKEVGFKSGFLHAKWFGEFVRDRFGVSPSAFRRSRPLQEKIPSRIS